MISLGFPKGAKAMRIKHGFTLIEMSIVLVLLSLIAGGGLHALNYHIQHKREVVTRERLREARLALLHFAQIHGHLPCPAIDMDVRDRKKTGGWEKKTAEGRCIRHDGFLPALTLGLGDTDDQGYAVDGWDRRVNRLRYAVAQTAYPSSGDRGCKATESLGVDITNVLVSDKEDAPLLKSYWGVLPFTQPLRRFDLCVCATAKCADAPGISAVAVVYALGDDAYLGRQEMNDRPDEQENLNEDRFFVSHTATKNFDDSVAWISSDALWGALIESGGLQRPMLATVPQPTQAELPIK